MSKIAEVENGNDEKGYYHLLKWNSSISTDKIQIYNRYDLFNGKIVFDNGFSIEVYGHEAESHLLDIRFEAINTNEIKYYPENHISSYMPIISVYHTNLLHKSTMSCSSIFSERNDLSFLPENVINNDDEKYWCPEVSDKNRYIQFDFKDFVEFNTTIIKQHYITNRILAYRVDYTADGSCWSTAARHTGFIYDKDNILKFERVGGTSVRLIIEECEPDVSGYDVPNITKFEVQNCI